MERDGHGAGARHPAEHAQVQDGQAGDPAAGAPDQRQLTQPGFAWTKSTRRVRAAPGQGGRSGPCRFVSTYFLGRTASLSCLAIRALTTVFAGNLDGLAGGRVAAHACLPLLDDELHHARQHELTRALELLFRKRCQLVEKFSRLRPLHLEASRRSARTTPICPFCGPLPSRPPSLVRADSRPRTQLRARHTAAESLVKSP